MKSNKRCWAIESLARYWNGREDLIMRLRMPRGDPNTSDLNSPRVCEVELPQWASDLAPDGYLLVPQSVIAPGDRYAWERTDWVAAIVWYLDGLAERAFEIMHGPIHSYSYRLKGWDRRIWRRAWANRMALFVRRLVALSFRKHEDEVFGPLPSHEIIMTHDLDALQKTISIRCKQSVFHAYNAVKYLTMHNGRMSMRKWSQCLRFLFSGGVYDQLETIEMLERSVGVRSYINVHSGSDGSIRSLRKALFDPGYSICDKRLKVRLMGLAKRGWILGLHQSYDSWSNRELMQIEKNSLESVLGQSVEMCRQHWLRFSWFSTWKTQSQVGIKLDMTLGFNDRSAFRNGAALRMRPWDSERDCAMDIEFIPLVAMDSHFYDYSCLSDDERFHEMKYWIDEVRCVRGVGSFLWHPHTLSNDYGWKSGFENMLSLIAN